MLLLESLQPSSVSTATSTDEAMLSLDSNHLLAQFVALTTLAGSPEKRESLQILWQASSRAKESPPSTGTAAYAGGDGARTAEDNSAPAKLLLQSASSVRELLRGLRVLQFDIMCLAVDECVRDISKHISAVVSPYSLTRPSAIAMIV